VTCSGRRADRPDGASVVVEHHFIHEIDTRVRVGESRAQLDKRIGHAGVPASEQFDSLSRGVLWLRRGQFLTRAVVRKKGGDRGAT
jgi:hypothetical protein